MEKVLGHVGISDLLQHEFLEFRVAALARCKVFFSKSKSMVFQQTYLL